MLFRSEFGNSLFVRGEFGLSKDSGKSNYFDLSGDTLLIVNEDGFAYYKQASDLKKLDVRGGGKTFIRNGDYVLRFDNGELSYRLIGEKYQNSKGTYAFAIGEIVNQKNPENPFRLLRNENGRLSLVDSSGNPLRTDGTVEEPPAQEEPPVQEEQIGRAHV